MPHHAPNFSPLAERIFAFLNGQPLVLVLMYFMAADIVTGLIAGVRQHKISSDISLVGMSKKVFVWIVVSLAACIEPFAGGIPTTKGACLFYTVTEFISIVENAGRAGVPMPPMMMKVMMKLAAQAGVPPGPIVIEKHTIEKTTIVSDRRTTDRETPQPVVLVQPDDKPILVTETPDSTTAPSPDAGQKDNQP